MAVEPCQGPADEANHHWLLLVRQDLHVVKTADVIYCHMHLFVAEAIGAALFPIASNWWPTLWNQASDWMSIWIRSPGRSHS